MKPYYEDANTTIYCGDSLSILSEIGANSVQLILTDPPYGTTDAKWDNTIDLGVFWHEARRILAANGTVAMTCSQPYSTEVVSSARDLFRYSLIWAKSRPTGFAHAKNKPLKSHEDILVFSKGNTNHVSLSKNRMVYNPQGLRAVNKRGQTSVNNGKIIFGTRPSHKKHYDVTAEGYPSSILYFDSAEQTEHPTKKPSGLFSYLTKTFSNESDIVVDPFLGSGTTALACRANGRRFIGIELSEKFCEVAVKRLLSANPLFERND